MAGSRKTPRPQPTTREFRAASELRHALRRFLRRSEEILPRHGLTPRQYDLLLQIKGDPGGRESSTVTQLVGRLHLNQSTVTELVGRAVRDGLVKRVTAARDRRVAELHLTADGNRRLAGAVLELGPEREELAAALARLKRDELAARRRRR